jgi:hypothetical protein
MPALARGEGFMAYKIAEARLRQALVPMLANRRTIGRCNRFLSKILWTLRSARLACDDPNVTVTRPAWLARH